MDYSSLANELGLKEEVVTEMGLHPVDIFQENNSSSTPSEAYYFNVPDGTPYRILGKKGWSLGERVKIKSNMFMSTINNDLLHVIGFTFHQKILIATKIKPGSGGNRACTILYQTFPMRAGLITGRNRDLLIIAGPKGIACEAVNNNVVTMPALF